MIAKRRIPISLARWFDSWAGRDEAPVEGEPRVDWLRCIPFLLLHVACFAVIWVGASWTAVSIAAGLYFLRMFAITAFYHRYFSHRAFKTSRAAQFCFALVANTQPTAASTRAAGSGSIATRTPIASVLVPVSQR